MTPIDFDAAGRGHDELGVCVVDARRELIRCKASEDDRVDRSDAGASKHRLYGLRNHRHVNDDAVPAFHALIAKRSGDTRHGIFELAESEAFHRVRHWAVIDERELVGAAFLDMTVERVVAGCLAAHLETNDRRAGFYRRGRGPIL